MSPRGPVAGSGITKPRAAAVSIASNSTLIALKLAAAAITGSVAILSEALHSMVDLIASVVAFVSVRKADEPADVDHPYGHEKLENVGAAIEAMLILVGAGVIVYEAVNRLSTGATLDRLGLGIAVIAFSGLANVGVSGSSRAKPGGRTPLPWREMRRIWAPMPSPPPECWPVCCWSRSPARTRSTPSWRSSWRS